MLRIAKASRPAAAPSRAQSSFGSGRSNSSVGTSSLRRRLGTQSRSFASTASTKRGPAREKVSLKPGDVVHGFKLKRRVEVKERNVVCWDFEHTRTGAQHLHVESDDTNNAFTVTFKTVPESSNGVAHILEHTALCGSKKFPVRDPFFNMLKRSLNTYMNAWTGPDYTMYPFSTQNEQDFKNLLDVYLDASFFPKLDRLDFLQEGHRLEFKDPKDQKSPLIFKGVVFNEMKGAMADQSSHFDSAHQELIFPTITYHYNSGGDPLDITNLTWEYLKKFHQTHYHPSNARFYTYGDLPLASHLELIDKNVLQHFSKLENISEELAVGDEKRLEKPLRVEITGPPSAGSDLAKQNMVSVAYLLNNITEDPLTTFSLSFASALLLNGANAPLDKALIQSNIGQSYSPNTGYQSAYREAVFAVGLAGITEEDVTKVENIIQETLEKAANEPFEQIRIDSLLHQIELSTKHVTTDFGIGIAAKIVHQWIHSGDPIQRLQINDIIKQFKEALASNPNYLQDCIKKYILQNPHKVTLVMKPDTQHTEKQEQKEQEKLKKIEETLTEEQRNLIFTQAQELLERQKSKGDVNVLPTIHIEDVSTQELPTRFEQKTINNTHTLFFPQPTNGITYVKGIFDISSLDLELLPYFPLFCDVLSQMGTEKLTYQELDLQIENCTGGIHFRPSIVPHHTNKNEFSRGLFFSSYALNHNVEKMFGLLQQILSEPVFTDEERLKSLVSGAAYETIERASTSGHSFALSRAASAFAMSDQFEEMMKGLTQLRFIRSLSEKEEGALNEAVTALQKIAKIVLNKAKLKMAVNAESENFSTLEKNLNQFLGQLPKHSENADVDVFKRLAESGETLVAKPSKSLNFFSLPISVNFAGMSIGQGVPFTHPDAPKLTILSQLLRSNFLHQEIREKGGAYGGGSLSRTNHFSFYSYRDPNILNTINTFKASADWLVKPDSFTGKDLEETKFEVFGDIDTPIAPGDKGLDIFERGLTDAIKQKRRDVFLATTQKDLVEMTEKYLKADSKQVVCVFGSEQNMEKLQADPEWHVEKV